MTAAAISKVQVDGLTLAYRELGEGPPVLLLHGWPTHSLLWCEVMVPIAKKNRAIALDLPGFGGSDKPLGVRYSFGFFGHAIDLFLEKLGIRELGGLAVHDLGGPIGLHWLVERPERVKKLALLNTLVYPEFSQAVKDFIHACRTPGLSEELTSPKSLESIMRKGLADPGRLSAETLAAFLAPFDAPEARRALAQAGIGTELKGYPAIVLGLKKFAGPVRIVYGERDPHLPEVAETMARVKADLPQAEVTALPECGHFLQLEAPEVVGGMLERFFGEVTSR